MQPSLQKAAVSSLGTTDALETRRNERGEAVGNAAPFGASGAVKRGRAGGRPAACGRGTWTRLRREPRFRDKRSRRWHFTSMAIPNAAAKGLELTTQAELGDELLRAEQDFAQGDFIELTVEDLDRCIAAGEWPWPTESSE